MKPSRVPLITLILTLVFFYLPIGFLVLNSFNDTRYASKWRGLALYVVSRLCKPLNLMNGGGPLLPSTTAN